MYPTIISPIIRKSGITLALTLLPIVGNAAQGTTPVQTKETMRLLNFSSSEFATQ